MTVVIETASGQPILVDDEDAPLIVSHRWFASRANQMTARYYATRAVGGTTIYMHRLILGLSPGSEWQVDHVNGDGLDNRRANLRMATRSQNNANRESTGGSGGYRGVYRERGRYRARIWVNGQSVGLGRYTDAESAAHAYDEAAAYYFGAFARLNFPVRAA